MAFTDYETEQLHKALLKETRRCAVTLGMKKTSVDQLTKAVGIAKGPERRPGLETLFLSGQNRPLILPADSAALHLVQQIRDEAHRFAITGHRQRRAKARTTSALDHISGIGPKRRQALLRQFGGVKQLTQAGAEDIARVEGINADLAQRIYDAFHGES